MGLQKIFVPKHFDIIWASPSYITNLDISNEIVLKILEIIEYLEPKNFVIDNPDKSLLKHQWFMYGIPYTDIDCCKYGKGYKKKLRLWNNISNWKSQPLCKNDCSSIFNNEHREKQPNINFNREELHSIPATLIYEVLESVV